MRSYLKAAQVKSITYRRQEQRWAVYSGYRDGLIYYTKALLSRDGRHACVFALTYPSELKRQLDSVVTRMSGSLRLGASGLSAR